MADHSAEQPLMHQEEEDEEDEHEDVDLNDVELLLEKNLQNPGLFVWLLTFSAGISGLLFGYDTGVISATLVSIGSSLGHNLTVLDKSLITSATALFALLVSPLSGLLADKFGRKRVVLLADLAFIFGAIVQAFAPTVIVMIAGRAVVGLAVGAGSFVTPLYIAELAPAPFRGRLMTLNVLFITLGQVVAYLVGFAFVEWGNSDTAWRWLVGLGAVPAIVQLLVMLFMPETPRWLVMVGKPDDAKRSLSKVFGKGFEIQRMVDGILSGIEREVREEDEAKRSRSRGSTKQDGSWFAGSKDTWVELFRIGGNRESSYHRLSIARASATMWISTIFTMLGFTSPTLTSLSVAVTNFIMTCVALVLIDRVGRRLILLRSIPIMALGLSLCAIGFIFIDLPADLSSVNLPTSLSANAKTSILERAAPVLVLVSIMLYVGAYAVGLGNVPWMQSELFPLNVRSLGSALSTSTNWGANFIVGLTFLPMMEFLTAPWTFVIYAGICLAGLFCIWRIYPETKGLSLEEVGALLAEGWGVIR